jgi:hypothetical protein
LSHWLVEPRHNPNFHQSSSHLQIDLKIYDWVQSLLNADVEPSEQRRRHLEDLGSLWFGLNISDEAADATFLYTDVYEDLIAGSSFEDKTQQFPSLSFLLTARG